MRFIYLDGPYTQFMGRMFAFKKPTEITDKATIAALLKRKDFMRVDEEPVVAPPAVAGKVETVHGEPVIMNPKRPLLSLGKRR